MNYQNVEVGGFNEAPADRGGKREDTDDEEEQEPGFNEAPADRGGKPGAEPNAGATSPTLQ